MRSKIYDPGFIHSIGEQDWDNTRYINIREEEEFYKFVDDTNNIYQAAGLNTVDVYVPWNLHEPRPNEFDFGTGTSQFSPFLNLTAFVEMIAEEDMLAIFRYIVNFTEKCEGK